MNLNVPLSEYRIFNAVAEAGTITKAAEALFISQPAVSKALTKLEQETGTQLFIRNSKGVHLTDAGSLLYSYTKEAFSLLSEGTTAVHRIKELGIGHIHIGASATLCKYVLLPYLKAFVAMHPHIKFTIQCYSTNLTAELLSEGKLDLGLIGTIKPVKGIIFQPAGKIQDIFVATPAYLKNLSLREGKSLALPDLIKNATVMLLDEKNITRQYINEYMSDAQLYTAQILEVSSMDLLIEFAKTGLGIACVLKESVTEELRSGILLELSLPKPIKTREVGFAYHQKRPLSHAAASFLSFTGNLL